MSVRIFAVVALALASFTATSQEITVTASYNGYPVTILPDNFDVISVLPITMPRAVKITKVTVKVSISYAEVGDLNVYLFAPNGTRTKLLERNCGSLSNVNTTFDDSAPSNFSDFCPAEAGRGPFRSNEPLSNFNGVDSSIGTWFLAVENNGSDSRTGTVNDATITITGNNQTTPTFRADQVLNSANLRGGVVSSGGVASITGSALGPQTPVLTGTGAWPTTLGGVQVNVNGVDIPIRYASSTRLDVQMPFGLTAGTANIKVTYSNLSSGIVSVPVAPTSPGLFGVLSGGTGGAKALNQDGTQNSPISPVAAGQVIVVYGIGLGAVSPPLAAGQVPPASTLSTVTNPVAASIGGNPATVYWAGLAPGIVGLYQINLVVPPTATKGANEVIVSNGGNASQNGLVIYVK